MAIRHNVVATEGVDTHATTRRLEHASDLVIVVAYVISVALYLRILAQFVVGYLSSGSGAAEPILAVAIVGLITLAGVVRGWSGVCTPCRRSSGSLGAVLVLVVAFGVTFAGEDLSRLAGSGIDLPPAAARARLPHH